MQPTGGGGGGGSLQRFCSAPATWLEALLESDIDNDVILDPAPTTSLLSPTSKAAVTAAVVGAGGGGLPPPHPPPPRTPPGSTISRHPSADLSFLDSVVGGGGGGGGLFRQNSSPADFLSAINSDGYFSSFGIPGSFDYLLPATAGVVGNQAGSKRPRVDSETTKAKLSSSPLKVEQSTDHGLLDAELDKLTEDAVLCRVRAKRGCATHPRSIAERVRRTRISDRIRRLQDLVPNMDKQTNTADMLDEAVAYVKLLQKQIQVLSENQKRCRCLANQ